MTINAEPLLDASQIAANAAAIAAHVADSSIHYTQAAIDHTVIANIGTNSHAALDSHLANAGIHYADAPADANSYVRNNNAWVLETVQAFGEYRGEFDASAGSFPVTLNQGDWFNTTVAGTVDGQAFIVGDILVALIDTPSTVTFAANWSLVPNISVSDHTLLTNIGINTHAQIDTHIADGSVHFTEASIAHANISGIGVNSHAAIDAHIGDASIHYAQSAIDHTAILNIGTNSHAALDAHLASVANPHGVTVQQAYVATGGVPHIVLVAGQPFTIRDNAAPIGTLVEVQDAAGAAFLRVAPLSIDFGEAMADRLLNVTEVPDGYGGVEIFPDGRTRTDPNARPAFLWTSTVNSAVPGGGGIGNDSAPNFVSWLGEIILTEQGNLFNTQSLFNQATQVTCEGANTGPIYTMINQPKMRTGALGGSRTGSQQNAVRSQLRIGPNLAGNFTLASHEPYYAFCIVDATVGSASITNVRYFAPKPPLLTAGGTIGALTIYDLPNIAAAGIGTLVGINSAMNSGTFINHTGTAGSRFEGSIALATYLAGMQWGGASEMIVRYEQTVANTPGDVWTWQWVGAQKAYWKYWTGFSYWTMGHNEGEQSAGAGAGLQLAFDRIAYSKLAQADPSNTNWYVLYSGPNLRTPTSAGTYADVLYQAGGSIDINGLAMTNVSAFEIASPAVLLSGGTIDDLSNLFVNSMPSFGATRVQALRVLGRARIDGRVNLGSESPAQITANQNDYQLAANNAQRSVVLLDSDAARSITGIDSSFGRAQGGDTVKLYNVGAFAITLTHEDVASLAANRIVTSTGAAYVIGPGDMVELWYDDTGGARWLMLSGTGA